MIGFAEIQIARYSFYKITFWCGTTALLNITEIPTCNTKMLCGFSQR